MLYALCHVFPCFFLFLFYVDVMVTRLHACMMFLAMPCLDLCVYACLQVYMVGSLSSHAYMLGFVFFHAFMLTSTCLDLCFHMPTCLDLCSLHAICYFPCACALHAMFMCLDLGYACHAMCYCSPFVPFVSISCVLAYWFRPDLDPMFFIIIRTPWPILKGLDHPICMSMFPCSHALSSMLASLVLGFATLDTLNGFVVVWLHLTPIRPCVDVTILEASPDARLLCAYPSFFLLCVMLCLPCLFAPPVGFLYIFTCLLTCPCMSLAY